MCVNRAHEPEFGTAALLGHHFTRQLGSAPSAYRRRFTCVEPEAVPAS
jgi:transcriptional regulator GlxA family with amidase domain